MHIAMVGTRGVPAAYGGFETAVEEIGKRLVEEGHRVTVYTRPEDRTQAPRTYLGMELVPLPAVRSKTLETPSHSAVSTAHVVSKSRPDMVFVFNAANAALLPVFRARGIPVATHVDGLEWKRTKWGTAGRRFYRISEALAVRYSDALIADAQAIADYYRREFSATTEVITYGAPILGHCDRNALGPGIKPEGFHLVVARFEPENHVVEAVKGYQESNAQLPLVVVGAAPFAADYTKRVTQLAGSDSRVQLAGSIWDQTRLDALYAGALSYLHGHSVGGTNPSLLRAMGAGTATLAFDVVFNREVLGADGLYFSNPESLAELVNAVEADPQSAVRRGSRLRRRAGELYDWNLVAGQYEELAHRLIAGESQAGRFSGRRRT
ncbi:MAG: DUF1972 domain-containing protein [Candidatus Nanopelagicales bacterium]